MLLQPYNPQDISTLTVPIATTSPQVIWIRRLENCEDPTGSTTIRILDTNDRYSYGVLQFQMKTWLKNGGNKVNIYDVQEQERIAQQILDAGGRDAWFNCSNKIEPIYGMYPK